MIVLEKSIFILGLSFRVLAMVFGIVLVLQVQKLLSRESN